MQKENLRIGTEVSALRNEMLDIVQAEMARHRKRLGDITPEQRRAVEALLVSTVNGIFATPDERSDARSASSEVTAGQTFLPCAA